MALCGIQPNRLWNANLGQCGNYLTVRPHLSIDPYRLGVKNIYPASNPAKYARMWEQIAMQEQNQWVWKQPDLSATAPGCQCQCK